MKKALITGAMGFVGRRFARRLLDTGWRVTGIDNMVAGVHPKEWAFRAKSFDHFDAFYGDLRDYVKRKPTTGFDLIIHCAAVVGGRLVIDHDPLRVATDLAIDADLFQWLAKHQVKNQKVIYFSSSAVYPVWMQGSARLKMREGFVGFDSGKLDMPDESYGWAKLSGELLARYAVKTYGLDVITYRPFSGYGEDQDFAYPFPSIVRRVVKREDPITVWGSGKQTRDFIYIEDVIDAVLSTMYELKPGEALNLGSGVGTAFADLAKWTYAVVHNEARAPNIRVDTTKPEGVFYRVADTEKLNLMWRPTTSLEEGIERVAKHLSCQK